MKRLDEYKDLKEKSVEIPKELEYIRTRVEARIAKDHRRKQKWITFVSGTVTLCIAFVLAVNLFPAVASAMSNIPILNILAKAVCFDKSLQKALENDYYQYVAEVQEKDGIKVFVDYMIVDASRISIFCREEKPETAKLYEITIQGQDGHFLRTSGDYSDFIIGNQEVKEIRFDLAENEVVPEEFRLGFIYNQGDGKRTELSFSITPDPKYTKVVKSLNLDKTLQIEGQTITLERLDLYPTQAKLIVHAKESNTSIITKLSAYLNNSNAEEEYQPVSNGVVGTIDDEGNTASLWFESPYFEEGELQLHITGIFLIDKDKRYGEINYVKKSITNLPEGVILERLELIEGTLKISLQYRSLVSNYIYTLADITSKNKEILQKSSVAVMHRLEDDDDVFHEEIELADYQDGLYQLVWGFTREFPLPNELIIPIPSE
ncbi:MAG: hypothetical protein K0S47_3408 [Herbinix sp.]|jgi:hypothetical protein|nr:hypothetical protein [Herbinix sp.]